MGRSPCCAKVGMNKGAWTAMEDKILIDYIKAHGEGRWRNLPQRAGLKRCGKSCRLRWLNYLRPGIKRGNITPDEEKLIIKLHKLLGNRWSLIAGRLPGRTDNEIKNYWCTNMSKRLNQHNNQAHSALTTHHKKFQKYQKYKKPQTIDQPKQPIESNVVRPKAVRCTKVLINSEPPQKQQNLHANGITNDMVVKPSSMVSNRNDFTLGQDEEYVKSFDFLMEDLNMGDFNLISELLNANHSDVCDFSTGCSNNGANDLSFSCPEQPSLFSRELLEDWLGDEDQQFM